MHTNDLTPGTCTHTHTCARTHTHTHTHSKDIFNLSQKKQLRIMFWSVGINRNQRQLDRDAASDAEISRVNSAGLRAEKALLSSACSPFKRLQMGLKERALTEPHKYTEDPCACVGVGVCACVCMCVHVCVCVCVSRSVQGSR